MWARAHTHTQTYAHAHTPHTHTHTHTHNLRASFVTCKVKELEEALNNQPNMTVAHKDVEPPAAIDKEAKAAAIDKFEAAQKVREAKLVAMQEKIGVAAVDGKHTKV